MFHFGLLVSQWTYKNYWPQCALLLLSAVPAKGSVLASLGEMGLSELIARFASWGVQSDERCDVATSARQGTNAPALASALPVEIVMSIFVSLCDQGCASDRRLLVSCSLICRNWSTLAQQQLFRHVSLARTSGFNAFRSAVIRSTPRGRMLSDSVIHLRCVIDANQPGCLTPAAFAKAVPLCPNLREVSLALYRATARYPEYIDPVVNTPLSRDSARLSILDDTTIHLLRQGPQVVSLNFDNWTGDGNVLPQLLDVWPSISSLSIGGNTSSAPTPTTTSVAHVFQALRVSFRNLPSSDVFSWLLHNSSVSLKNLDFQREPSPETLTILLRTYGSHLKSLTLPSCASHDHINALVHCSALRTLRVNTTVPLPYIMHILPASIEYLTLVVDRNSDLHCVARGIKGRLSKTLQTVTIDISAETVQHPELPTVRIACAVTGVSLRVITSVRASKFASQPFCTESSGSAQRTSKV